MSPEWATSVFQLSCAFVLLAAFSWYKYQTHNYGKWSALGVPHVAPSPPFGNLADATTGRVHLTDVLQSFYDRFRGERCFGIYEGRVPIVALRDPRLIQAVLIKDFGHFCDRIADNVSFVHDKLFNHLFNMRGDKWKLVRAKLSPTFTAAKLKSMLADIDDCKAPLIDSLTDRVNNGDGIVNISKVSSRFAIDVIGRCAFGLDYDSLAESNSNFRRTGQDIFKSTRTTVILNYIRQVGLGRLLDVFRIRSRPKNIYDFFDNLLETAMEQHKIGESTRNDFIALLVRLKNEEELNESGPKLFTDDILAANVFIFFIAGFETTATTISFCLYELAKNQEIQAKLRKQIQQKLNDNDGKLSYDTLKHMKYLDMVINETLRLYPPVFLLKRVCTKNYTIPDSSITLNVGQTVIIPVYSLHRDPKYYPDPEVFDPERFTDENKNSRQQGTYLPFGDGPRMCIGSRFAMMEARTALAGILSKFEVLPCEDTQIPIKIHKKAIILTPEKPIKLLLKNIVQY